MKMKLVFFVMLAACTFGFAKEKADVRDVTGCLAKGDSAKEFLLTGNDGSTWECGAVEWLSPSMWVIR
jgi:hypothetical protein